LLDIAVPFALDDLASRDLPSWDLPSRRNVLTQHGSDASCFAVIAVGARCLAKRSDFRHCGTDGDGCCGIEKYDAGRWRRSTMTDIAIARALHVLAVVLWIGGVAMVTTVLLPAIRRAAPAGERFALFHAIEGRFAAQARWTVATAGVSGFYMAWRLDVWDRFRSAGFWWMHAMVAVWALFALMLFVFEPLFLDRFLARRAAMAPEATYRTIERLHRALLALSLVTVAGAVAGSYGFNIW
jgi:uncharacterized membrane protein